MRLRFAANRREASASRLHAPSNPAPSQMPPTVFYPAAEMNVLPGQRTACDRVQTTSEPVVLRSAGRDNRNAPSAADASGSGALARENRRPTIASDPEAAETTRANRAKRRPGCVATRSAFRRRADGPAEILAGSIPVHISQAEASGRMANPRLRDESRSRYRGESR